MPQSLSPAVWTKQFLLTTEQELKKVRRVFFSGVMHGPITHVRRARCLTVHVGVVKDQTQDMWMAALAQPTKPSDLKETRPNLITEIPTLAAVNAD